MKLTVLQIVNALEPARRLTGHIPARISFMIAKNIDAIERELGTFEKTRNKLFEQYKPAFEGNSFRCETPSLTQAMADELNELLTCEVEFPIEVINLDQVGGMTVDPADMRHLMWMFEVSHAPPTAP